MILQVDRKIYDDVCISKAIYSLSDKYTFSRSLKNDIEYLEVSSKTADCVQESIVLDSLNDFKLRGIVETETKDIRTILFAKAFGDIDE